MKKNFSVNIGYRLFNVDEDAYEMMNEYLDRLRKAFSSEASLDEIMKDIEQRIADLLFDRLGENRSIVSISDIEFVIGELGQPEEMGGEPENKKSKSSDKNGRRRLFRDPEDRILGGVCSGLAAYFDVDTLWVRLGFIVLVLIAGSGILLYLALWALLPLAMSTADRLLMKGEKVNASNIRDNIKEEFHEVKNRFSKFAHNAKNEASGIGQSPQLRTGFERFMAAMFELLRFTFRILAILFALIFICIGIFLFAGFLSAFFFRDGFFTVMPYIGSSNSLIDFFRMVLPGDLWAFIAIVGLSLLVFIPLLHMVLAGIRVVLDIKKFPRFIGISSLSLWIVGLLITILVSIKFYDVFSAQYSQQDEFSWKPSFNTIIVDGIMPEGMYSAENYNRHSRWVIMSQDEMKGLYMRPVYEFEPNTIDDSLRIIVVRTMRDENIEIARRELSMQSIPLLMKDSVLQLPAWFSMNRSDNKWRYEKIKVSIYVPSGLLLKFTPDMIKLLQNDGNLPFDLIHSGKTYVVAPEGLREAHTIVKYVYPDSLTASDSIPAIVPKP